jgi:hypothetical protein
MTVNADTYNKIAFVAPGETLRPGSFFVNGKENAPTAQGAAISFPMTVFLTDQFWNPVGPMSYPNVKFSIAPTNAASFINGVTLGSPVTMPGNSRLFTVTLAENSNVKVEDNGNAAIFQTVPIPIGPGLLDHFRMIMTSNADKEAGVPFNVTIRAEDRFDQLITGFNNTISLAATTGANTMTPSTVSVTNGVFLGDLTCFAATQTAKISMTFNSVTTLSDPFRILTNSAGYKKLILLGFFNTPFTLMGKPISLQKNI